MGYALDVLGHAVFGEDMGSAAAVLGATVPAMNEHVTRRALSPVRLPAWWPTPTSRRARQARRSLQQLVDDLIARRRSGPLDGGDLLSLLLSARDPEDGSALDDVAVRDQALIFLLAGHETAGSALAFSLHLLGRHPAVQERVRSEVAEVVGTGPITAGSLERPEHTTRVVSEALRLYPPAHILVRRATEPASLCGRPVGRLRCESGRWPSSGD
ncbi:MAG: cytochrome P450 [Acidimicrobiales bacterium]